MVLILGDYHQGSVKFSELSRGRQCIPNCVIFLCLINIKNVKAWNKQYLHFILDGGDALYKHIRNNAGIKEDHLLFNEVPNYIKIHSKTFILRPTVGKCYSGTLKTSLYYLNELMMSLEFALNLVFCSENKALCAILVFCDCAISLAKHENMFLVFDPHSRCNSGFCDSNGNCRLGSYENLADLCKFLRDLARSLSSKKIDDIAYDLQVVALDVLSNTHKLAKGFFHFNVSLPDVVGKLREKLLKRKITDTEDHECLKKTKHNLTNKSFKNTFTCSGKTRANNSKHTNTSVIPKCIDKEQRLLDTKTCRVNSNQNGFPNREYDCQTQNVAESSPNVLKIMANFHSSVKNGPLYVCSSCNQTWFREGVYQASSLKCQVELKIKCMSGQKFVNNLEWVCRTCKKYLEIGNIPPCSVGNDMKFPQIPSELQDLSQLEARLISPRIPFMAVREQPRGGQLSLKGNVINVPADVNKTVKKLPRTLNDNETIMVKFKRKLSYKHSVVEEMVRPNRVVNAVKYLVDKPLFKSEGITLDINWSLELASNTDCTDAEQSMSDEQRNADDNVDQDSWNEDESFENRPTGNFDTLLHPVDFREFNKTLCIAPGEGHTPLGLFQDINSEFLSFPTIYCGESRKANNVRKVPVHYSTISKWELRHVDRRVALNIPNLFFKMKKIHIKFLQDRIQIALRKCKLGGQKITVQDILAEGAVDKLVKHKEGFQILKNLRGSPAYWEAAKKDLFAMIKQLGIPTWFISLSAAETKWEPLLITLGKLIDGKSYTSEEVLSLSWHDKCRLINSDPVTCVRYFDYRVQKFIRDVVMGSINPLGQITDFFYRVEFQQRGSPHIHMVVWVQNAPDISIATPEEISRFTDRHITCENDMSITSLINYQTHRHARTCRKKGKSICRFNFPIPPMPQTVVLSPLQSTDDAVSFSPAQLRKNYENISEKLSDMKYGSNISFEQFLTELDMTEEEYILAIRSLLQRNKIFLKRTPSEIRINSYSKVMLKCWQANIDVQFILDAYSCAAYIVSYISKGQRGMSNLMYKAVKEAEKGDMTLKDQMRLIGNKFLTHVEIGAQEAVYLVLQMPLRMSSRSTLFIPTSPPDQRLTILKSVSILEDMELNSTNIEADNVIKRYQRRPTILSNYCLADFASWFEVRYPVRKNVKSKKCDSDLAEINDEDNFDDSIGVSVDVDDDENLYIDQKEYRMQDGGILHRRKKQKILHYVRYNQNTDPENYYRELLMLFLPWRNENTDIPTDTHTLIRLYTQHKNSIESKRLEYEKKRKLVDLVEEYMYTDDSDSNQTASTSFMPNCEHTAEQERAEGISFSEKYGCFDPGKPTRYDIGNDIGVTRKQIDEEDCLPTLISQAMYLELVRNLNRQQKEYFYHVLHWFKTKSDPMYNFLSGGAGVGKSVLTRAIYQALLRCLNSSKGSNPDDIKILLCAPTGKAAHNINGNTIHSTFCIPVGRGFDYKPLHMEQLNVFRAKYQKLRVILIDEISMVGCRMLNFINCRLQEIMGVEKPFGGVSMIAIGDLFQLKPVMDSWIFAPRSVDCGIIAGNLWQDNFKLFELTQIMRQKDDIQFAELLNRLREGLHTQADIEILKSKQLVNDNTTSVFSHLYTSRKEVELFNEDVFTLSCNSPSKKFAVIESLDAVSGDLEESKHASVLEKIPIDASKTMGLLKFLKIAEGLTADISININVEDGLTNGASGIIKCIDHRVANSERCSIIWMLFNDPKIGVEQRNQYRHLRNQQIHENWTPIFEVNRKFHLNSNHPFQIIRRQFPLHLAAARTIHKAQGSSLDDVVVHFGQRKWDHMHYVGLSRVRSLAGLHILHLNEEKIAVNPEVIMEMDRLRSSCSLECCIPSLSLSSGTLTLVFHNSRSLHLHFQEMQEESNLTKADIIGISETRLSFNDRNDMYNINGFKLYRNDSVSFGSTRPYHGSAVFSRLPISNTKNLLFRGIEITFGQTSKGCMHIRMIFIYCPPKIASIKNIELLMSYLSSLDLLTGDVVILGDFNIDILRDNAIGNFMHSKGFLQLIKQSTTDYDSCLDHIYTNIVHVGVKAGILESYYSDHKPVFVSIQV